MAATPSASERIRDTSAYSSMVVPQTFTMTVARRRAQLGQLLVDEPSRADALQADGVEHAGRRFDDTRRRMTLAGCQEQPLGDDGAERGQVDEIGVLDAVPEAAARRDERVAEGQRSNSNREIHHLMLFPPADEWSSAFSICAD